MNNRNFFKMSSAEEMLKLYEEARDGFLYLINIPDNKYVEEELINDLGICFTDIKMVNKAIELFWFHENTIEYTIEVFLSLQDKKGEEIGEYVYVLDHEGNGVDDRFFYSK